MPEEVRESLLATLSAQAELFSQADLDRLVNESIDPAPVRTVRECTAEHLFRDRPHIYKAVVTLTAEGLGQLRIRDILKVHTNTIAAVQEREGGAVEILKERIAALARRGAQICIESIIEKINDPADRKKMTGRDLAIIAGVLTEKAELLSGGATSRVQHVGQDGQPLGYDDYVQGLPAADVIDVTDTATSRPTGIQGETAGAKGALASGAPVPAAAGRGDQADPGHGAGDEGRD